MAEYIDKEAFISRYRELYCKECSRRIGKKNGKMQVLYEIGEAPCRACDIDDMLDSVEDWPAADVREKVKAEWEEHEVFPAKGNVDMLQSAFCPNCKRYHTTPYSYYFTDYAFCPNCGARMDGSREDGDA